MSEKKKKKPFIAKMQFFADPFQSGAEEEEAYTKKSKQLLDGKLRKITENDLQRSLPLDIERGDIEVAIQGGLGALSFSFLENWMLHAVQTLFSRADYPLEITPSRWELYEAMGLESHMRDGKKYYPEGPHGKQRKRIHSTLLEMARKTYLFIYSQVSGYDNKGDSLHRLALTYAPIIKVAAVYEDVKQLELKGLETDPEQKDKPVKKRFSHYKIRFNVHALGEIDRYFRYLPSGLAKEISDYRKQKGQRPSSYEFDFIEYLYTKSRDRIEINYLKLAEKLRIKQLQNKKIVRRTLNRCYETARNLNYLIKFEIDQPGLRAKKDVFYLNPIRFYKLKKEAKKIEK